MVDPRPKEAVPPKAGAIGGRHRAEPRPSERRADRRTRGPLAPSPETAHRRVLRSSPSPRSPHPFGPPSRALHLNPPLLFLLCRRRLTPPSLRAHGQALWRSTGRDVSKGQRLSTVRLLRRCLLRRLEIGVRHLLPAHPCQRRRGARPAGLRVHPRPTPHPPRTPPRLAARPLLRWRPRPWPRGARSSTWFSGNALPWRPSLGTRACCSVMRPGSCSASSPTHFSPRKLRSQPPPRC